MIAFIDCYIETPVNTCVNQFIEKSLIPCSYHIVSKFGVNSLLQIKSPTCYIILGSAAHVSEENLWQKELIDFIIPKLKEGIPVLGICFGHQLLARHFGSKIDFITPNKKELKESRVIKTQKFFGSSANKNSLTLGFSHAQIITDLTEELEEIGYSKQFRNEIIKHRSLPFYGTQAHPEADISFLTNDANIKINQEKILEDGFNFILNFYHFAKERFS